jgi:hypothetical protein
MTMSSYKSWHYSYPVSAQVEQFTNLSAVLAEGLWRKSLARLCPWTECQHSCFLLMQPNSLPWQPLQICQAQAQVMSVDVKCHAWLLDQLSGTHTSWILLCSSSFTRDWWQSKINLEFIWNVKCLNGCLNVRKNIRGLSGKYPAIFNISRTGRVTLM